MNKYELKNPIFDNHRQNEKEVYDGPDKHGLQINGEQKQDAVRLQLLSLQHILPSQRQYLRALYAPSKMVLKNF
jgi:hypothetical protein